MIKDKKLDVTGVACQSGRATFQKMFGYIGSFAQWTSGRGQVLYGVLTLQSIAQQMLLSQL